MTQALPFSCLNIKLLKFSAWHVHVHHLHINQAFLKTLTQVTNRLSEVITYLCRVLKSNQQDV